MIFGRRKAEAEPEADPVSRLFEAVDEVNEAWKCMPKTISVWIDWSERRVYVQCRQLTATEVDEDTVRGLMKKG